FALARQCGTEPQAIGTVPGQRSAALCTARDPTRQTESCMHAIVQSRSFERQLYLGASLVFLALVFWTFAHSYYLRFLFDVPPLNLLLHVHGVVMSRWVVLLVVQSSLIVAHRPQWHRTLGAIGGAWAVLVVALGSVTTVHAAAREVQAHTAMAPMDVTIMWLE